jgi:hypothetical protein
VPGPALHAGSPSDHLGNLRLGHPANQIADRSPASSGVGRQRPRPALLKLEEAYQVFTGSVGALTNSSSLAQNIVGATRSLVSMVNCQNIICPDARPGH